MFLYLMALIFIVLMLVVASSFFALEEQMSGTLETYECGFEPIYSNKTPIYIHFFSVGVLFLLFDIELIVSVPLIFLSLPEKAFWGFWFTFFLILFVGLGMEVMLNSTDWKESSKSFLKY